MSHHPTLQFLSEVQALEQSSKQARAVYESIKLDTSAAPADVTRAFMRMRDADAKYQIANSAYCKILASSTRNRR